MPATSLSRRDLWTGSPAEWAQQARRARQAAQAQQAQRAQRGQRGQAAGEAACPAGQDASSAARIRSCHAPPRTPAKIPACTGETGPADCVSIPSPLAAFETTQRHQVVADRGGLRQLAHIRRNRRNAGSCPWRPLRAPGYRYARRSPSCPRRHTLRGRLDQSHGLLVSRRTDHSPGALRAFHRLRHRLGAQAADQGIIRERQR